MKMSPPGTNWEGLFLFFFMLFTKTKVFFFINSKDISVFASAWTTVGSDKLAANTSKNVSYLRCMYLDFVFFWSSDPGDLEVFLNFSGPVFFGGETHSGRMGRYGVLLSVGLSLSTGG